jgi:hypothetical protein
MLLLQFNDDLEKQQIMRSLNRFFCVSKIVVVNIGKVVVISEKLDKQLYPEPRKVNEPDQI